VLIAAGKGYIYARPHHPVAPAHTPAPPAPPAGVDLADALSRAMGGSLPIDRYRQLVPAVVAGLRAAHCDNPKRVAQWFAQIGHESAGLRYMEEIADGSAYEGRADLGNTQPGDGMRYKGHGPIQITGRENHRQVSEWAHRNGLVPSPTHFVDHPNELGADQYGMLGAAWYWTVARGTQINDAADREDIHQVTKLINGGLHGIDDRIQRYHNALPVADAFVAAVREGGDIAPPPPPAPAAPLQRFWPMTSERVVTSPFGPRWGTIHTGVDFGVNGGSGGKPVYAIQSGTVLMAGDAAGYGGGEPGAGWLVIDSDDSQGGGVYEYGHIIAAPGIGVGSKVNAGDMIAAINPNEATNGGVAPHLHLSFMPRAYDPGQKIDPLPVLEGYLEPGAAAAPPPPAPAPAPAPEALPPSLSPFTPLTGRPHHHSVEQNDHDLLLDMRAENLLTQALVFAIAEKVGVDARAIYEQVRNSF
jgi:predicted chitinase